MNTKELAELLNDVEYGSEKIKKYSQSAKENDLVIVYGASDDLMEFDGAIEDELDCYGGGTAYLTSEGLLKNECDNEDCPYFEKKKLEAKQIMACWNMDAEKGYCWSYKSIDIPHKTFDICEDGEKYCKGIVFSLDDVK